MSTPSHVRDHVYSIVAHPTMSPQQKAEMLKRVADATTAISAPRAVMPAIAANNYGATVPGNLDLANRPYVHNKDGSVSTVRSIGANINGKEVLMPTVSPDGRIMSDREAIDEYVRTGKHMGIYPSARSSDAAGEAIHEDQMRAPPRDTLTGYQPPGQFPGPAPGVSPLVAALGAPQPATVPLPAIAAPATAQPVRPAAVAPPGAADEIDRQRALTLAALSAPTVYPETR